MELDVCPGLHADDITVQVFGGLGGGQDAARGGKERSAGRIEVVGVLMMGEEHDVDRVLLVHVECGACQLRETSVFTGRRERRVGQPAKTAVLQDRCGSSHELNAELRLSSGQALIGGAARHRGIVTQVTLLVCEDRAVDSGAGGLDARTRSIGLRTPDSGAQQGSSNKGVGSGATGDVGGGSSARRDRAPRTVSLVRGQHQEEPDVRYWSCRTDRYSSV